MTLGCMLQGDLFLEGSCAGSAHRDSRGQDGDLEEKCRESILLTLLEQPYLGFKIGQGAQEEAVSSLKSSRAPRQS
jgi:hypothetical protein